MATYTISNDYIWESKLEIKEDQKTRDLIETQLLFFMTDEQIELAVADNGLIETYLEQIAKSLITESMQWNKHGVIKAIGDYEGFLPIDGTMGVELISIDQWAFDDFDIERVS